MSDDQGYSDDAFSEEEPQPEYEEDFEDDEQLLEAPAQHPYQQQQGEEQDEGTQVDVRAWPSLQPLAAGPAAVPGVFGRPLFAGGTTPAAVITAQPPPPPMSDGQRRRAAQSLARARALQPQHKLAPSRQLELLVLQPLSLHQQHCQGVGVFAGRAAAAACQTQQLGQEIQEQDAQTDEIDTQAGSCQVPDDLHSTSSRHDGQAGSSSSAAESRRHHQQASAAAAAAEPVGPAVRSFVQRALPQVLFELQRSAAESGLGAAVAAGLRFAAPTSAAAADLVTGELPLSHDSLLAGRAVVGVCGPATPAAAAAAAAAITQSAASSDSSSAAASSHLVAACYSPVRTSTEAAALAAAHSLPGLGCLCIWDLAQAGNSRAAAGADDAAGSASSSGCHQGVLQLLVSEGRPSCCCWGVGGASCMVFAGMEEGGVCCWDLSEPDSMHPRAQLEPAAAACQPPQDKKAKRPPAGRRGMPARRPAYTTETPPVQLLAGDGGECCLDVGSISAVAALPLSAGGGGHGASAGAVGNPVCQLVTATASGCVSLFSVLLGSAGSDAAVCDLGMRTGSRVWLVKMCACLPLGLELTKAPHMRRSRQPPTCTAVAGSSKRPQQQQEWLQVCSLAALPGPGKQLLVGRGAGRVLKAACLGATAPPHEYTAHPWLLPGLPLSSSCVADTSAVADGSRAAWTAGVAGPGSPAGLLGAVLSLSVCPACPDAWLAGLSCGRLALFSQQRSRPVMTWHHPHGLPVLAVRWLPQQPCAFVALCGTSAAAPCSCGGSPGCLLAFDLAVSSRQPSATLPLVTPPRAAPVLAAPAQACCMEVLVTSGGSTTVPDAAAAPPASSSGAGPSPGLSTSSAVVVGFEDGSSCVYQLGARWASAAGGAYAEQLKTLEQLLAAG